jgi:16S rRNA (guanine527-N7)-methyltransferase
MITSEAEARQFCAERTDRPGLQRLEQLAARLIAENQRQNLVSAASLESVWQRHFADSLQLLDHVPHETSGPWLDLGSGAGFPGLVIAIARPASAMILVESRKRRVEWLTQTAAALGLENCRVLGSRLESVENFHASAITARAFAPLGKLLALSSRFSTRATVWLLPKGRSAAQELAEQPPPISRMFHVEQSQTDPTGGIIVGQGTPDIK